jgi:hypothetical protein
MTDLLPDRLGPKNQPPYPTNVLGENDPPPDLTDYTAGPRPSLTLLLGDTTSTPTYATVHELWLLDNKASTIERLRSGWQYRAIFPDGGTVPTFVLVASSPLTSADMAGPPAGYAGAFSLFQSSWPRGHRALPKD